jgi:hypothetical protein
MRRLTQPIEKRKPELHVTDEVREAALAARMLRSLRIAGKQQKNEPENNPRRGVKSA